METPKYYAFAPAAKDTILHEFETLKDAIDGVTELVGQDGLDYTILRAVGEARSDKEREAKPTNYAGPKVPQLERLAAALHAATQPQPPKVPQTLEELAAMLESQAAAPTAPYPETNPPDCPAPEGKCPCGCDDEQGSPAFGSAVGTIDLDTTDLRTNLVDEARALGSKRLTFHVDRLIGHLVVLGALIETLGPLAEKLDVDPEYAAVVAEDLRRYHN